MTAITSDPFGKATPRLGFGSKVTCPPLPVKYVSRARLCNQITQARHLPLVLISAGPGWGKTALLSEWTESADTPVAWVSLDPADDRPSRFWSLVAQALHAAGMIIDLDALLALQHDSADPGPLLAALTEAIGEPAERSLIIDDAHLLRDPTVLAELHALIRYLPSYLRLVLSSRQDPLLPLHKYRLNGRLCELRADDLAMTPGEARSLLTEHGVRLASGALAALMQRTEGWTAALRLSAMSMAGSRHPGRFVNRLRLDQSSLGEYLTEEVLVRQPRPLRQVLIQTSFLAEFTGPLAAAVTGFDAAPDLLWDFANASSLLRPVDGDGDYFRYHPLLAEILRYLLAAEYPDQLRTLRDRAASWFEKQGDTASALRYAADAENYTHAADILAHGGLANAFVDRQDLGELGLDALDPDDADQCTADAHAAPEVRIAQAALAVSRGKPALAERSLRALPADPANLATRSTAALVKVMAAEQKGDVAELDRAAEVLIARVDRPDSGISVPGLQAAIRLSQASVRFWQDDSLREVETLAVAALISTRERAATAIEMDCLGLLQLCSAVSGRLARLKDYDAQARQLLGRSVHLAASPIHHLAHAHAAFLRADFERALRALRRAERADVGSSGDPSRAERILLNVRLMVALGRIGEAHELVHAAPELTDALPLRLARDRLVATAEIETLLGRPSASVRLLRDGRYSPRDPAIALATARALLRHGDTPAASSALRPVLHAASRTPPRPLLIEAWLLSALIADSSDDETRAVNNTVSALDLAAGEIIQPFAAAGGAFSGLLARHAELRTKWPASGTPSLDTRLEQITAHRPHRLVDPLTDREREVLHRLTTTSTTAEIAEDLCLSVNTVKTHIAAIYRKLPAAGRREAVHRARELELL